MRNTVPAGQTTERWRHIIAACAAGLLVILCWRSVVLQHYAFWDDYRIFVDLRLGTLKPFSGWFGQEGRPVFALFAYLASFFVETHRDLLGLRLIQLLGLAVVAGLFSQIFRRVLDLKGWSGALMACAAALCCTLTPSLGVFAGWATPYPFGFSIAACLWAGHWFWLRFQETEERMARLRLVGGASMVILLGEGIYQPNAGFFIIAPTLALLATPQPSRALVKSVAVAFGVMLLTMLLYAVLFKAASAGLLESNPRAWRSELDLAPVRLFVYLKEVIVPQSLQSWAILFNPSWRTGVMSGIGAVFAIEIARLLILRRGRILALRSTVVLAAFLITVAPVLVVKTGYTPLRVHSATHSLLASVVLVIVAQWAWSLPRWPRLGRGLGLGVILAMAALVFGVAEYGVRHFIVEKSVLEQERFTTALRALPADGHTLRIYRPDWDDVILTDTPGIHAYGLLSARVDDNAKHLVHMLAYEAAGSPRTPDAETIDALFRPIEVVTGPPHEGDAVTSTFLDTVEVLCGVPKFPYALAEEEASVETPLGPFFRSTAEDWLYHPAWGFAQFAADADVVTLQGFGAFRFFPVANGNIHLQNDALGTFSTNVQLFPRGFFFSLGKRWGTLTLDRDGDPSVVLDFRVLKWSEVERED